MHIYSQSPLTLLYECNVKLAEPHDLSLALFRASVQRYKYSFYLRYNAT